MNRLLIKVDHTQSRDDVVFCRKIGVNCLGITITNAADMNWIGQITKGDVSDVCLRFDLSITSEDEIIKTCHQIRPWGIDFTGHFVPGKENCQALISEGFRLFFSNIEASYDTDPSWILSRYEELHGLQNTFFQIDLLEETADAWCILRNEVSDESGELTLRDLDSLSQQHNILLNLNFTSSNIIEIMQTLPSISGIAFSLSTSEFRRPYSLEEIYNITQTIYSN